MVSDALYELEPSTIILKRSNRVRDGLGDMLANFEPGVEFDDARVIPASQKDLDSTPEATTYKEVYSVYLFDSVEAEANDVIEYLGDDYEVIKGWDRDANGDYTKFIIARHKRETSTNA
jgi:hypothetical protein